MVKQILSDLVAIPTISKDLAANTQGIDYIESFLQKRGMYIDRQNYKGESLLVATSQKTKHPKILFTAHLDVVPAPADHFILREENEKLYGRGTWDMKHAIAAYLATVDQLQSSLSQYDFGICIFTDDESHDRQLGYILDQGYSCDVAILPDGSDNWHIEASAKGLWRVKVSVTGKSCHGSRPWEGDSASLKMIDLLHEFRMHFIDHGPETDTLNVGLVHSGSVAWNQLPDSAEASFDIRIINTDRLDVIKKQLTQLLDKYQGTLEEISYLPPLLHDRTNHFVKSFAECIFTVTGVKDEGFTSLGASSAWHFVTRGLPCIVVSPPGGGRHSDHEWIEEKGLREFPEVIARYIQKEAVTKA